MMKCILFLFGFQVIFLSQGAAMDTNTGQLKLTVPVEFQVPLPMRGESGKAVELPEVVSLSGNRSKIVWRGVRYPPGSKEDLVSHVAPFTVPSSNGKIQPEDIVVKFAAELGIERSKLVRVPGLKASGEVVAIAEFKFGTVVEINTTLAGWRPGNTSVFLISKDQTKAVKIDPAWHLRFNWSEAIAKW